jgi:hypothetical protein
MAARTFKFFDPLSNYPHIRKCACVIFPSKNQLFGAKLPGLQDSILVVSEIILERVALTP